MSLSAGNFDICVIGGGAAGMTAAISASRSKRSVVIVERMPKLGKKILASGNGRCNLLNDDLGVQHYNEASRPLVSSVFKEFGKDEIMRFFTGLGLKTYSDGGRIFPVTNQAATVLRLLELELARLGVAVMPDFSVSRIARSGDRVAISSKKGASVSAGSVIVAAGGRSYPALGSDGSGYELLRALGHTIVQPVPSAVPLLVKDRSCHLLQGQKVMARARAIIDGKASREASGDVLFTKYGLSGTAILDISEEISVSMNRSGEKDVVVSLDLAPSIEKRALELELSERKARGSGSEDLFVGILPNRMASVLSGKDIKDIRFRVEGTRGWNEAEFTAGGVNIGEVSEGTLGSKLFKGLYLAGEVLDVDGARGGYNLAWAWASGLAAGLTK